METLKKFLSSYLRKYPPSLELFMMLERAGDLYLIGGVLREFKDNGNILNLRDIDIIIDVKEEKIWQDILQTYQTKKNSFGGYKLTCSGLIVDIWSLRETWAYRNKIVRCAPEKYVEYLSHTVFLNIDTIIYDLKRDIWYDEIYQDTMKRRVLDVVLEDNPQISLNILRAMVLKKRYSMTYSPKLKYIMSGSASHNENFVDELLRIQLSRYHKEILSKVEIEEELYNCIGEN